MYFVDLVSEASQEIDSLDPAVIAEAIYDDVDDATWMQILTNAVSTAQANLRNQAFSIPKPVDIDTEAIKNSVINSRASRIRRAWPDVSVPVADGYKRVRDLTADDLRFKIEESTKRIAGINKTIGQFSKLLDAIEKAKVNTVGELSSTILENDNFLVS